MTGSPRPPRRHSPAVYRRRRLVVLIGLLIVVALVAWLLIAQPWRAPAADGKGAPAPSSGSKQTATALPVPDSSGPNPAVNPVTVSPTPKSTTTPKPTVAPSPSSSADAVGDCVAAELRVQAVTDRESYTAKQKPKLSITLTNTGKKDCTLNVGTSTQRFVITSGDDTWWRSTDCQSTPSDQVVLLAAGQKVTSATPLVWDRTRSSVKTCKSTSRPKAPGGGASYHLSVQIAGVSSEGTRQFVLD